MMVNFRKNISDIWHFGFFYFYRGMPYDGETIGPLDDEERYHSETSLYFWSLCSDIYNQN